MKSRILFSVSVLLLAFFGTPAKAQNSASQNIRPQWMHKLPQPTNSTFQYKLVSASAPTEGEARDKCRAILFSDAGLKNGVTITTDTKTNEKIRQTWNNGRLVEEIKYDANTSTSAKSAEVNLYAENVAEYWKCDRSGNCRMTVLFAKSELGQAPLFDNVELTNRYGARGLWRSAIVPGWGQFYKGANLKGGLILGGCAVLAAGIVFTENQRSDYVRKIAQTHSAELKRTYATKRDHFATGRNICIGAIAALYVYNLIDAVAAPGAQRIVVHPRNGGRGTYAFAPTILHDGSPALAASVTF